MNNRFNRYRNTCCFHFFIIVLTAGLAFVASPFSSPLFAQVTLVIDEEHNATSVIEATTSAAGTALKQFFENPAWESISKVQNWLKDASTIVSNIIKNMKMTRELIQLEEEMWEILGTALNRYIELDYWPTKWLHRKLIIELWAEKVRIFESFDIAIQQNKGIIDDEGRILLIKQALKEARATKAAMKVLLRRSNKDIASYERAKREIELFGQLFQSN